MSQPLPAYVLNHDDNTIKAMLAQMVRMQNGDISRAMNNMGIKYTLNYGVSALHIKATARQFSLSKTQVFALWEMDIREAKLLAIYSIPEEPFNESNLLKMLEKVDNMELAEHFSRQASGLLTEITPLLNKIWNTGLWPKIVALHCAAWWVKFNPEKAKKTFDWSLSVLSGITLEHTGVYSGTKLLLQQFHNQSVFSSKINHEAEKLTHSANKSVKKAAEDFLWINTN